MSSTPSARGGSYPVGMRMRFLLAVAVLAITGCRLAGAPATDAGDPQPSSLDGVEAPEACGFPEGTALSFAGRSTTSQLHVQEVVGDPMSDDPADIYITRDAFDQGELHGRLVCALFVDHDGFVEVTVHPADGGRFSETAPAPTVTPTPLPSGFIEITTHCGLDFVLIQFEGQQWRFDVEDKGSPPEGWGFNTTVVHLKPGSDGPIVIGPDGSEWQLVPADPDDPPGLCM